MRKILEEFYLGNIIPSERQMAPSSELKRAVSNVTQCEQQLNEQLNETGKAILGFRLGVRMMAECMDENDGSIQRITDHG